MLACCVATGLVAAVAPAAHADDTSPHPGVGGHVGVAVPLVFLNSDKTQTIGDQFTLAFPIGIGFKLTEKAAIDFETIVGNPIHPRAARDSPSTPGSSSTWARSCSAAGSASTSARRPTSS
jgi:hypothetical protein